MSASLQSILWRFPTSPLASSSTALICVEDALQTKIPSEILIKYTLQSWFERKHKTSIVVICMDHSVNYYQSLNSFSEKRRGNASTHVVMLDCCCNSLGWNNNNSNDSSGDSNVNKNTNSNNNSNKAPKNINSYTTLYECTNVRDINEITASLETIIKGVDNDSDVYILIDSVSAMLLKTVLRSNKPLSSSSINAVLSMFVTLQNKYDKIVHELLIVPILHGDVHSRDQLNQCYYVASDVITLAPPPSHDPNIKISLDILHKHRGGKISRTEEHYEENRDQQQLLITTPIQRPLSAVSITPKASTTKQKKTIAATTTTTTTPKVSAPTTATTPPTTANATATNTTTTATTPTVTPTISTPKKIFTAHGEKKKEEPTSTFSLTMTEEERQAKQNIKLPYMHHLHNKSDTHQDEEEEYEEDPDDDLDI